jgi:nucleotide-binding universal stress UspA family protein
MFERILVTLDGSKMAEMVLPYVIEIASRSDSYVFLIRICEMNMRVADCRDYLEKTADMMERLFGDLQKPHPNWLETIVRIGNPADVILEYAREIACDLIAVAATHSVSGGDTRPGKVTAAIYRAAACPVLLIRKPIKSLPSMGKHLVRKILVPLDGSELGEAALPLVRDLAGVMDAELVLFRVDEAPVALQYLNGLKDNLNNHNMKVSVAITEGSPGIRITEYAGTNDVDLIAMSTHGRSGLGRLVHGSVTDKVLRTGDKPVMVVRPTVKESAGTMDDV